MKVIDLPLDQLREAPWNPNQMDEATRCRLQRSIDRFGLVVPLVVRRLGEESWETIGGAQRLAILTGMGRATVPCVVLEADDATARMLSQALNRIAGEDDLGLRAELMREALSQVSHEEVLSLLPETVSSLEALCSLGQDTMAEHLQAWQIAQVARLKHLQFQLTPAQLDIVEEALQRVLPVAKEEMGDSPNLRGTALYVLCKEFLERQGAP